MEIIDIEKRAFLFALKAIYFDQSGARRSALNYYVAAGEALLEAANRGSRIPDLKRKARLYCDRAERLERCLDDERDRSTREEEGDWDKLEDAADARLDDVKKWRDSDVSTDSTDEDASAEDDVLMNDYVVIYNSAVDPVQPEDAAAAEDAARIIEDAAAMARLTRRVFAAALEADAAGNVEEAFLLYMRAVEATLAEQRKDSRSAEAKTRREKQVEKKMRILAAAAIERVEAVKEEMDARV